MGEKRNRNNIYYNKYKSLFSIKVSYDHNKINCIKINCINQPKNIQTLLN